MREHKDEIENSRGGQLFPSSVAQSLNGEEIGDRLLQGEEFITLVKYRKLKAHVYFVSLSIYILAHTILRDFEEEKKELLSMLQQNFWNAICSLHYTCIM